MKLYSDFAVQRGRQVIADFVALALIAVSIFAGITVSSAVDQFSQLGRQLQTTGVDFRTSMTDAGTRLGGVPFIGEGISSPFTRASSAGDTLAAVGQTQQDIVRQAAIALGVGVAALPILIVLLVWLLPRLRFVSLATRTRAQVRAGLTTDLLALRALSHQKVGTLTKVDPDAAAAWRRGDPVVMQRLAGLELRSVGIRIPSPGPNTAASVR
ncbi:hypothetical protein DEU35_0673 [Microbacterium sp. AG157]|uniref:hypothetical protein n=1 Tax=Microbacterium sp. AG157 TaxID=2183993 RepID=UPI000E258AF1|nr:hypothetical protein [Microbacterium sp. AG157]REC99697.1 hypothetical protein DEU35_0673 [Microbacterium sp. AG157]